MAHKKNIHSPLLHDAIKPKVTVAPKHAHKPAVKVTVAGPTALLTYNAQWEKLTGTIGEEHFDEHAVSGGSRGHKPVDDKTANLLLHDEAYMIKSRSPLTQEMKIGPKGKEHYIQRGGTIPPGHYICRPDYKPKLGGEVIYLDPQPDALVYQGPLMDQPVEHGRNSMFIHGPGPKGSDGCIIFDNNSRRMDLNKAIKHFIKDLHGKVILNVVNDGSFILPPLLTDDRYSGFA
ncbi:MAG TPA: hypothetical protein VNW04_07975 [Puia sp.]|nr:hypothetical protein [Puia sp.]